MSITVKKENLWRGEDNEPGTFARALELFAKSGSNLQIVRINSKIDWLNALQMWVREITVENAKLIAP